MSRHVITYKGHKYFRYHLVWYLHNQCLIGRIDHKDGNSLNDDIGNLRECSQGQNRMNQTKVTSKSGYKGVSWANGCWIARIKHKGKQERLLYSQSKIECALA